MTLHTVPTDYEPNGYDEHTEMISQARGQVLTELDAGLKATQRAAGSGARLEVAVAVDVDQRLGRHRGDGAGVEGPVQRPLVAGGQLGQQGREEVPRPELGSAAGQLDGVRAAQPVAQERQRVPGVGAQHQGPGVGPGGDQLLALVLGAGVVLVGPGGDVVEHDPVGRPVGQGQPWPMQNPADRVSNGGTGVATTIAPSSRRASRWATSANARSPCP